jgi:cyclopropane-fatty-acyl-phospholipid synthase
MNNKYEKTVKEILALAGIQINGSNPWDIRIHNQDFYRRAIVEGELGFGESYMDGWWDAEIVDNLIDRILKINLDKKIQRKFSILLSLISTRLFNLQSIQRAFIVGEKHYDLGNDLFQIMLDRRLN